VIVSDSVSENAAVDSARKPQVLFVYYSYTDQTRRVAEVMAEVLRGRGCDVSLGPIGFTDDRWAERFTRLPMRHAVLDILGMLPAQVRGATGEIEIPEEARDGNYDLVCIGSPTWFFRQSVPIRSYLKSEPAARLLHGTPFAAFVVCRRYWRQNLKSVRKVGTKLGGEYVDGMHLTFEGGQIRSFMSLISYFAKGENRERYLGVKIPPSMLRPDFQEQAQAFANELADGLSATGEVPEGA
jgi:menaquinone-dependent protoporphyrinogen IX oxidase